MKSFRDRQEKMELASIDISPLIDVVFILLIFFVITTTFSRQTGVDINKPKAASSVELSSESLLIAVTREGTIHIHDRQVDINSLRNIIRTSIADNRELSVIITADRNSSTGKVIEVLDECKNAGVVNVSIASTK